MFMSTVWAVMPTDLCRCSGTWRHRTSIDVNVLPPAGGSVLDVENVHAASPHLPGTAGIDDSRRGRPSSASSPVGDGVTGTSPARASRHETLSCHGTLRMAWVFSFAGWGGWGDTAGSVMGESPATEAFWTNRGASLLASIPRRLRYSLSGRVRGGGVPIATCTSRALW